MRKIILLVIILLAIFAVEYLAEQKQVQEQKVIVKNIVINRDTNLSKEIFDAVNLSVNAGTEQK